MKRRGRKREPENTVVLATIGELAPSGEGVAICETTGGERRAIFVPGVATGEVARVECDLSTRPARGRVLELLTPSVSRVPSPCPYVGPCGGCDWMHLAESTQLVEHARIVERQLPPAFAGVKVKSHPAPQRLGYRTRARLHVEGRRGVVRCGMYGPRSHRPAEVDACVVLDPTLERARKLLPSLFEGAEGKGEARLALGRPGEPRRAVLDVTWSDALPATFFARAEARVNDGSLAGVRAFQGDVRVPATIGDATPWIVGADDAPLQLAPGGFSQASEEGNASLARRVAELAREIGKPGPCVELYAGAGNLTTLLARDREVVAVESDSGAVEAAKANFTARGLEVRVSNADAATYVVPRTTKLLVLDPPRTGAREVVRAVALSPRPVPAIVYVSCDPPTLGRDLAILADAGYAAHAIETFEMFPQTSHVETVVALVWKER